jgi:SAM-dependent methyltransferase
MYLEEEEIPENPLSNFWLEGDSLAPPCQAELDVVESILDLAEPYLQCVDGISVPTHRLLYDLGCGDGRICTEATRRFGCKSIGCEIEPRLIEQFAKNIKLLHLGDKVTTVQGDLCELELAPSSVIVAYLLPESVELIREKLINALKSGSVVIFNTWGLKGVPHKLKVSCGFANNCNLLLYDASCISS